MSYEQVSFRGLLVEGEVDYDPGYLEGSCGGCPESWDIDIKYIAIEDVDELNGWEPFETDVVEPLTKEVKDKLILTWQESMEDALVEQYRK